VDKGYLAKSLGDHEERSLIAQALAATLAGKCPKAYGICGPADSELAWACLAASRLGLPLAYVRKSKKGHGLLRQLEGEVISGMEYALVVASLETSDMALIMADAIRGAGGDVRHCVGIGEPSELALSELMAAGIEFHRAKI